jgi:hypothetical protein
MRRAAALHGGYMRRGTASLHRTYEEEGSTGIPQLREALARDLAAHDVHGGVLADVGDVVAAVPQELTRDLLVVHVRVHPHRLQETGEQCHIRSKPCNTQPVNPTVHVRVHPHRGLQEIQIVKYGGNRNPEIRYRVLHGPRHTQPTLVTFKFNPNPETSSQVPPTVHVRVQLPRLRQICLLG